MFRCKDQISKLAKTQKMNYLDYLYMSSIILASYMYAQSSKLLSLTEDRIMPIIMLDKSANFIRQCGPVFPSQQLSNTKPEIK